MYVTGKLALSCRSSVIHWMKSLLFSISRGVYTNVPAFRYDLGEFLIIMNDKKKRIVKLQYLNAYLIFDQVRRLLSFYDNSSCSCFVSSITSHTLNKTKTVYLSVTSWFFSLLTIFFQNSFRFESINKFYVNLEQRQVI